MKSLQKILEINKLFTNSGRDAKEVMHHAPSKEKPLKRGVNIIQVQTVHQKIQKYKLSF